MKSITAILKKIYLFFTVKKPDRTAIQPVPVKKKRVKREVVPAMMGQFDTIKSALTSLDAVFYDMKKLLPKKSDSQKMVRSYGTYIASLQRLPATRGKESMPRTDEGDGVSVTEVESGSAAYGYPSFLINYHDANYHEDPSEFCSHFLIANKIKKIPFFKRPENTVCYDCTYVFLLKGERYPSEMMFYATVNKETRAVEVYPYLAQRSHTIIGGRQVSGKMCLVYSDLYDDQKKHNDAEKRKRLIELFCLHFNLTMRREMDVNIIVKKGNFRATITVPPNRWKYFFKDRLKVATPSGRSKPIFHAVASHHRHLDNGKVSNVKTHYRGLRRFTWDGYNIVIVMPGKHAVSQAWFDMESELIKDEDIHSDMVCPADANIAKKLNDIFEGSDRVH